jgi:hypothetical protein
MPVRLMGYRLIWSVYIKLDTEKLVKSQFFIIFLKIEYYHFLVIVLVRDKILNSVIFGIYCEMSFMIL